MTRVALFQVLNRGLLVGLALLAPACKTTSAASGGSYFTLNLPAQRGTRISGIGSSAPTWDGQGSYFSMAIEPEKGTPIQGRAGQVQKDPAATFYSTRPGAEGAAAAVPVQAAARAEEIVPVAPELPFPTRASEFKPPEAPTTPAPTADQGDPGTAATAAATTPATPAPTTPAVPTEPPPPTTAVAVAGDKGHDDGGDSGDKKKKKKQEQQRRRAKKDK